MQRSKEECKKDTGEMKGVTTTSLGLDKTKVDGDIAKICLLQPSAVVMLTWWIYKDRE
jgi:hypothetical protein